LNALERCVCALFSFFFASLASQRKVGTKLQIFFVISFLFIELNTRRKSSELIIRYYFILVVLLIFVFDIASNAHFKTLEIICGFFIT
jgi:hypothetical protein